MKYGKDLLQELEQKQQGFKDEAIKRQGEIADLQFDSSDSFLSEWANHKNQERVSLKIAILKNNGKWIFTFLADLDGNIVSEKLLPTRYGLAFLLPDGKWVGLSSEKTLAKKGCKLIEVEKNAWVSENGKLYISKMNRWLGVSEI